MATIPTKATRRKHGSVLPGFGLTLGFSMVYLSIIVLLPLSTVFVKSAGMGPEAFAHAAFNTRTLLAYRLSFGAAAAAAAINMVAGLLVAWILVRYEFPGKRLLSAVVDLPFALPTAVAGIALDRHLCRQGAGRCLARAIGHQDRLHADRHRLRAWSSSACPSSCARSSRCWPMSAPMWRRPRHRSARPLHHLPPRDPARGRARPHHRLRARLRARHRRIWLDHLHRRQHAVPGPRSRRCGSSSSSRNSTMPAPPQLPR
jgi:hypothetical protein